MAAISQKTILTPEQTNQKIKRVAFEIYERNFEETEIILAGIVGQGYELAKQLNQILNHISPIQIALKQIEINKTAPHQSAVFDMSRGEMSGKVIIVVDDVLHTGRTLAYSLSPFVGVPLKKLQVAVMVNRGHRSFPISADYVGYSLSTTLEEHIEVLLSGDNAGVYLS
jgi:pyrimidine operon attenuation protein / uracil phosphoribosyltransferase